MYKIILEQNGMYTLRKKFLFFWLEVLDDEGYLKSFASIKRAKDHIRYLKKKAVIVCTIE